MDSNDPKFSIPSILAILCAIGSFTAGAFAGFLLAVFAMILGVGGFLIAFLPHRRGGFVSALAVFAGVIGILAAAFKGIAWIT
ncbi:MAG TPA: hypothetical protein VG796_06185 [Verrucomicrobiales bacterium]|jgi:hypothetical protein|nr:hypothetical protein [Verrucomicrobiales bacterium]